MEFEPVASPAKWITPVLALIAWGLAAWLFSLLRGQPVSPLAFWLGLFFVASLVAGGLLLYWSFATFRLRYFLDRNGLLVRWGLARQRVPLAQIEAVVPGQDLHGPVRHFRGLVMPGLRSGEGELAGIGAARFLTSASLAESLAIRTASRAYVISPRDRESFVDAWQVRVPLGPTQSWPEDWQWTGPGKLPLWSDRVTWGLAGGALVLFIYLLGFVFYRYESLPQSLPVHFNALGQADRIANKDFLLNLTAVGGLLLLFNLTLGAYLHQRERLGAYFLWAVAGLVQLGLLIAMRTMIGG